MGSISNPNTWPPYDAYKDCSQQICSIYCPQWCYMIFTPPPPPSDYSASNLSPLIIALIGILASAFLLISYYAVISKYCKRRDDDDGQNPNHHPLGPDQTARDQWEVGPTGLDESVIKSIRVCKYRKGDGLVEGTECAVCLSEFGEDENLRLLPNCSHAFHLPCIDAWLKSHSNCPLCRSTAAFSGAPPPQISSAINVSPPETDRRDDVVVLVDDPEMGHSQEAPASASASAAGIRGGECGGGREIASKSGSEGDDVGVRNFRRSVSLGSFSSRRQLLIADILRMGEEEEEEDENRGENSKRNGNSGTGGIANGMKRSVSTGRAMFVNKGKISIIPT